MDASWHWPTTAARDQRTSRNHSKTTARHGLMARISSALLLACIFAVPAANIAQAAPADPIVTENTFSYAPRKLSYFEDSPIVLYHDLNRNVYRSPDEGKTWVRITDVPEEKSADLIMHAFDSKTAFILTRGTRHYKTTDQGASWTPFDVELTPIEERHVLSFHATRRNWILMAGTTCDDRGRCHDDTYYTKDGFQTPAKKLLSYTHKCEWAVSSKNFDEAPTELIHCLEFKTKADGSTTLDDIHMVKSQDFFETKETVMFGSHDRSAIVNFVTKETFMLAAEKHITTGDMSLYVSNDAKTWAKANFPHPFNIRQDSYTILESTPYSLVADVKAAPEDTFGTLMLSNSNGTYFVRSKQYTNRNKDDTVDFEKIQNIDGVYIVNVVDNYDTSPRYDEKKLRTQISFEAGASWQYIMAPSTGPDGRRHSCTPNADGSCSLHLHSVTSAKVTPPIFSSKAAPGVVMGVGNVGPYLLPWAECDTYLSEDGGITWRPALERPHKYEFGDMGGLIVAVRDDGVAVSFFQHKYDLGDNIHPGALISDPESTSQKFMLIVRQGNKYVTYQLDLTRVFDRKCERNDNPDRSDFEKWYARNVRNVPDCLMGVKTWYWRRKANAECMVQESFQEPSKTEEVCPCTDEDFECDYNFVLKDGECIQSGKEAMAEGTCKKEGDTYLGSSGYRKVPGNNCDSEKGLKKDEPKTKTCTAETIPKDITHSITKFDSPIYGGFQYFLKSSAVMLMTQSKQVWRSGDGGSTWKRVLPDAGRFVGIYIHDENEKVVYLIATKDLYVSHNNGESFDRHDLPAPPNRFGFPLIDFHPDSNKNNWLLYLGQKENECFTTLYRSQDAGRSWKTVDTWVDKAVYASHRKLDMPDHGIFSMAWKKPMPEHVCQDEAVSTDANPLQMVYMLDADQSRLSYFDHVVQFYVVDRFLVVAVEVKNDFILHVSLNGHKFAQAVFPPNIRVDKNGFTVLQSTTGALVVDVAKSNVPGREHGRLFKSNSNGTYFSLQLDNTNRNEAQLVDWEKIGGIEGVILANQVFNTDSLSKDGEKHLRTLVSFNDGGTWNPIRAPAGSDCDGDDCYLHLHSVTDYDGPGAVFSAPSSVGLVMGVGNVGKHLLSREEAKTYLSRDAGKTWRKVSDTHSLYEFGDEGGVLVLVDPTHPTQEVSFSYDFGSTWERTTFAEAPVMIQSVTTEPTSHTSKITVTGMYVDGGQQAVVSTLDFSARRDCVMDKGNKEKNDFERWSPFEGEDDRCILGREITYWRRKPDRTCRVNDNDGVPDMEQANCKCTEKDFECDIGFFKDETGGCQRFGHDPEKPGKCDGTYMSRSGFRRIEASACKDGVDLENKKVERQCGAKRQVDSKMSAFSNRYIHEQDTVFYFPDSDVAMLKLESHAYISDNDGKDWKEVDVEGIVTGLQRHPYDKSSAVIGTAGRKQYLTQDRGINWDLLELPLESSSTSLQLNPWSFHPTEPGWMIFLGETGCGYERDDRCHAEAFYSMDAGKHWQPLATWVRSCSWARDTSYKLVNIQGIYCEQYSDKTVSQKTLMNLNTPVRFVYSDDFMRTSKILFDSIVGYAVYSDYLIAAEYVPSQRALQVAVSMDGVTFTPAKYPANFDVVNPAYTVLDSTTRSVFMAINVIDRRGYKVGNLFTSNSNGTYFSLSKKYVSESDYGNVDFEKMQGVDGVALLNEVINPNEANQGIKKKLRSMITVDNGNTWNPLNAPQADVDNKPYKDCTGTECSLHLHNYLDRKHVEDLFSSPSIPGMMIGVGNVGATLGDYAQGNTFLTRNGGHSWKEILHGPHQYDFGDHGSIILLVKDDELPTDHVMYSLDHGNTFQQFEFTTEKVIVKDIVTKPNGIAKSFLLFAVPPVGGSNTAKQLIYQIDFAGLDFPTCSLNLADEENDDFERWSIADLHGDQCMFGRKVEYFRRIEDRQCFVGEMPINPRQINSNCQCTAKDFECDFNYVPDDSGKCVLIEGAKPVVYNEKEICASLPVGQNFYYESIGYRKMAFSSCVGDHELFGKKKYCPGRGGLGFFGWVGILMASGAGAYGVIWLLYRYKGYFGGRGSFIRLGDDTYDNIQLPRSSSLPTMNMPSMRVPRSFSRSLGRLYVPDMVYQVWDKVSVAASGLIPNRLRGYFSPSGYRYQNLSQEPGEVIMDDYFDHYLDDDDEDNVAGAVRSDGLLGHHGDDLQDAQERYRDDSEGEDGGDEDLDAMV
ncbi:vacuolar protein sorting/targeting protein PEP1 [Haplosporangium sp. Z 767]|nr:vacuolar protein sorting/targeting protein PEP1 [Haplosporangium sp. Z 767]KAF9190779.1 vacuolar protein sorting/targeting protein PEP1 [Haplosporangium sp. Z 11]